MRVESNSTRDLVAEIASASRDGHGLVALLGSGISVESGIPTGDQLSDYFQRVMRRCLCGGELDLTESGWPPLTETEEPYTPGCHVAPPHLARVFAEADRACKSWTDMLGFLSQVKIQNHEPCLDRPDQRIVDGFAYLLTRDARPNFAHVMLAQLSRCARVRTVLTTNFDELLEHAFSAANLALDVYDVSVHGTLPDFRLVTTQPAIIKLHGTRVGIRADASIHHAPDRADVYMLAAYLSGQNLDPDSSLFGYASDEPASSEVNAGPLMVASNLLVVGFGGRDLRIMELLIRALRVVKRSHRGSPDLPLPRIHWVCHSERDLENLNNSIALVQGGDVAGSFSVSVEDAQLFLHELYNELTKTVPSRGLDYDFVRDIAAVPRVEIDRNLVADFLRKLGCDRDAPNRPSARGGELVIPVAGPGNTLNGISSLGAALYWTLTGQDRPSIGRRRSSTWSGTPIVGASYKRCVWLDTGAFPSPHALVRALLSRMTARTGGCETGSLQVRPDAEHIEQVARRFSIVPREWVVFIYARDGGGGADLAWMSPPPRQAALGCDGKSSSIPCFEQREDEPRLLWTTQAWGLLSEYLSALRDAGFSILYMPFDSSRHELLVSRLPQVEFGACHEVESAAPLAGCCHPISEPLWPKRSSAVNVLEAAIDWALDDASWAPELGWPETSSDEYEASEQIAFRKLNLLHALSLCRQYQSRFLLLSNATFRCADRFNDRARDNDVLRARFISWAVDELRQKDLLRYRPGGFVWMHRDVRLSLAAILEGSEEVFGLLEAGRAETYRNLHQRVTNAGFDANRFKACTHLRVAEAYEVAFRSANSHWLIIEQVYHLQQAILHSRSMAPDARGLLVERCLTRAQRALRSGIPAVQRELDPELAGALFGSEPPLRIVCPALGATMSRAEQRTLGLYREYEREWARARASFVLEPRVVRRPPAQRGTVLEPNRDDVWAFERLHALITACVETRFERARRNYGRVAKALWSILKEALDIGTESEVASEQLLRELRRLEVCESSAGLNALRRQMQAAASAWLDTLPFGALRRRKLVTVVRIMSELCWLWTDELEDCGLFSWVPLEPSTLASGIRDSATVESTEWRAVQARLARYRSYALRVCVLGNVTHDLVAFLGPEAYDDEDEELLKLESYYAQGLGYLERFVEAHRHLNHAFSQLSRSRFSVRREYRALLELRRGAVYLLQAQSDYVEQQRLRWDGRGAPAARRILATLDDAWLALTRARASLVASTRSTRHWGRLFVYELRTIALYADLERATNQRIEGLVDRLPGGRMRRALDILQSEAALDRGTCVRGAQVVHSVTVLLECEASQRQRRGHPSVRGADVRKRIEDMLRQWCDRLGERDLEEMRVLEAELGRQLNEFVADVEQRVRALCGRVTVPPYIKIISEA